MKKLILIACSVLLICGCSGSLHRDEKVVKYPISYSIQVKYLDGYCDTIEYFTSKKFELRFIIKTFECATFSNTKISPSLIATIDGSYEVETVCTNVRNFKIINKTYE